jgi:hypothetical protein
MRIKDARRNGLDRGPTERVRVVAGRFRSETVGWA